MQRKQKTARTQKVTGNWRLLVDYSEAKLRRIRAGGAQLEAMIALFRAHAEAGDPCPIDLVDAIKADKQATK